MRSIGGDGEEFERMFAAVDLGHCSVFSFSFCQPFKSAIMDIWGPELKSSKTVLASDVCVLLAFQMTR